MKSVQRETIVKIQTEMSTSVDLKKIFSVTELILQQAANTTQRIEVTVVMNTSVSRNTVTNSSVLSAATVSYSKNELTAMHCDWMEAFHP
jgi:hypothetical protein